MIILTKKDKDRIVKEINEMQIINTRLNEDGKIDDKTFVDLQFNLLNIMIAISNRAELKTIKDALDRLDSTAMMNVFLKS